MAGLEDNLTAEAVKTASGILSAAIAPKIEKIKKWALEKELKEKLKTDSLTEIMEQYLNKLSHRVSEITSITFQQVRLDIFAAYEPLFMCEINHNEHHLLTENDFLESDDFVEFAFGGNDSSHKKIDNDIFTNSKYSAFLVIDSAGMGKSTFSKFIVANVIFKSDKIPILIELRKLNTNYGLIENLANELDLPGSPFDRALFYKLLELGKIFIILDGFDGVKIEDQNELANEIQNLSIKSGKNTLVVTSRPQDITPELVKSKALKFLPFTTKQAVSLLERYDKISKLDIGERLKKEISNIPERFIESPLLVSLLYRTFGVNNSIADRISTFYDEIYHALYKGHDLINKNGFAREKKSNLDFEDFRKLLRALAHYMMLSRTFSFKNWSDATNAISKAIEISGTHPQSPSEFLDDLLVAVPLLQRDGNEYKFYHKTIIEYFAAEFIIFNPSNSELLEKILKSKISPGYFKVFDFINDINKPLYNKVITSHFANSAKLYYKTKNLTSRLTETVRFVSTAAVGLWSLSEINIDENFDISKAYENDSILKALLENEQFKSCTYHAITWMHGTIENRQHVLAITWDKKQENLHKDAWELITREEELPEEQIGTFDGLEKYISPGNWTEVDSVFSEGIKHEEFNVLNAVFATIISNAVKSNNGTLRTLCIKEIEKILKDLKKQDQLRIELEQFL